MVSRTKIADNVNVNVMNVPVVRPQVLETTALGAAMLAGLGAGVYASAEETAKVWRKDLQFEAEMTEEERNKKIHGWHKAVVTARAFLA